MFINKFNSINLSRFAKRILNLGIIEECRHKVIEQIVYRGMKYGVYDVSYLKKIKNPSSRTRYTSPHAFSSIANALLLGPLQNSFRRVAIEIGEKFIKN